ncbi:MAG: DUF2292 domain-containing protein [Eubacteriales bacterium]
MNNGIEMRVNKQEKRLLELIHRIKFGELKIMVQDSMPIRAEELLKSIEL